MKLPNIKQGISKLGIQIPILVSIHFVVIVTILLIALIEGYKINKSRSVEYGNLIDGILVNEEKKFCDGSEAFLSTWASTLDPSDPIESYCSKYYEIQGALEFYGINPLTAVVVNSDLQMECSTNYPDVKGTDMSDREYINEAVENKILTRSGYLIGKLTGKPATATALPLFNNDGSLKGILVLSLSLDWLNTSIEELPLPLGSEVLKLDSDGKLLAKYPSRPGLVGKQGVNNDILKQISSERFGTFDAKGIDNIRRVYVFSPGYVKGKELPTTYTVVGVPWNSFIEDVGNLQDKLITLVAITFILEFVVVVMFARNTVEELPSKKKK